MYRRASAKRDEFEAVFAGLFSLAYRIALRILGDPAEAEDAASETLARALVSWPRLRRASFLEAWIARVASNVAIDTVRRRRHIGGPVDEVPTEAPESGVVAALVARGLLSRLPRRQREVIVLRFMVDMTEDEVAAALGISKGAVKSHAHRALASLRSSEPVAELTETAI